MYSAIGYLRISPSQELLFSGDSNSDIICTLTLTNISKNMVAYKIKTTAPLRYKVLSKHTQPVSYTHLTLPTKA